jgi:hypothetical protein
MKKKEIALMREELSKSINIFKKEIPSALTKSLSSINHTTLVLHLSSDNQEKSIKLQNQEDAYINKCH